MARIRSCCAAVAMSLLACEMPGCRPGPNAEDLAAAEKIRSMGGRATDPWLYGVDLRKSSVTDGELEYLTGLANLRKLKLAETQISDAGLAHLTSLTNLQKLDLSQTQITDAGLAHLKGMRKLESLYLDKTCVTDAGAADLSATLPGCSVWSGNAPGVDTVKKSGP